MKPNKGKEEDEKRRRIKTGSEHKIGELAELDGAELGRLSNEARESGRTGELDSADGRDLKRTGQETEWARKRDGRAGNAVPECGCNLRPRGLVAWPILVSGDLGLELGRGQAAKWRETGTKRLELQ